MIVLEVVGTIILWNWWSCWESCKIACYSIDYRDESNRWHFIYCIDDRAGGHLRCHFIELMIVLGVMCGCILLNWWSCWASCKDPLATCSPHYPSVTFGMHWFPNERTHATPFPLLINLLDSGSVPNNEDMEWKEWKEWLMWNVWVWTP